MKLRYLTDKEIEDGIKAAEKKYGSDYPPGTGKAYHQSKDGVRIAYAWLDAQKKIQGTCRRWALKHVIEEWGRYYVSSSDVLVAASLHPYVQGAYPHFNISNRFTFPSRERKLPIGKADTQKSYGSRDKSIWDLELTYKRIEMLEDGEFSVYRLPTRESRHLAESHAKIMEINNIEFGDRK